MPRKYNSAYLLFCGLGGKVSAASLHRKPIRPHLDQAGLFLGCVSCHSSTEVLFLLNFLLAEGRCEIFGLKDLADLYVGLAFVGAALDPLDGLLERLDLPEPEGGDEFLAFGEGSVSDDAAVLAREMDAGAFGGGVKTVIAYQDPGFQEVIVEFVQVGHELRIGGLVFGFFRAFDDDHESHFVCPFGLSRAVVQVHSLIAALPIRRTKRCRIDTQNREYSR